MCFSSRYLGIGCRVEGGGGPKGLLHNLLLQLFSVRSSKIQVSETHCFLILRPHKMTIQPIESMLRPVFMGFPHFFGMVCGSQGIGTQPAVAVFHPRHLQKLQPASCLGRLPPWAAPKFNFPNLFFL